MKGDGGRNLLYVCMIKNEEVLLFGIDGVCLQSQGRYYFVQGVR
jgi:hypothetical protein